MLPTSLGAAGSTSLLGPSLLDGNSRDSFVSRSIADVAEVRQAVKLVVPIKGIHRCNFHKGSLRDHSSCLGGTHARVSGCVKQIGFWGRGTLRDTCSYKAVCCAG